MSKCRESGSVGFSIEQAVASYLVCECCHCTQKQHIDVLLEKVRVITSNPKLTMKNIKQAIKKWLEEGWAIMNKNMFQITHAGRAAIKKIADEATAPPSAEPA